MNVHFLGAARTVTGSCFIIETEKVRFAVDCGMHQGSAELEERNKHTDDYGFDKLDFILLTHAHMDHSGLLPKAVQAGFRGSIYCTEATQALLEIMLQDSGHIQEMEAEWLSRKRARQGQPPVPPLYTVEDAMRVMPLVVPVYYGRKKTHPDSGVHFAFRDAGHILGSSFLEVGVEEGGVMRTLVFSGDLGRVGSYLMDDPESPATLKPDYLFLESTYGDRNHKSSEVSVEELVEAIQYSYAKKEKIIIPAFAIERTQEILFILRDLFKQQRIPPALPVYLDSPLAIRATKIFNSHIEFFNDDVKAMFLNGEEPLKLPSLVFAESTRDSQELNEISGCAIIISASGMCNAGRVRHHLRHNVWKEGASIVFTGYQAASTTGRSIVDGAKSITIRSEELAVNAKIYTIGGFSGHAGQDQLVDWVKGFAHKGMQTFLVHGEEKAQTALLARLAKETASKSISCPDMREVVELDSVGTPLDKKQLAPGPVDWESLVSSLYVSLKALGNNIAVLKSKSEKEQMDMADKFTELRVYMKNLFGAAEAAETGPPAEEVAPVKGKAAGAKKPAKTAKPAKAAKGAKGAKAAKAAKPAKGTKGAKPAKTAKGTKAAKPAK